MESALTSVASSGSAEVLLCLALLDLVFPVVALVTIGAVSVTGCSAGLAAMISLFIYSFYSILGGHVAEGLLGMYTSGKGLLVATVICVDPPSDLLRDWEMLDLQKWLKAGLA